MTSSRKSDKFIDTYDRRSKIRFQCRGNSKVSSETDIFEDFQLHRDWHLGADLSIDARSYKSQSFSWYFTRTMQVSILISRVLRNTGTSTLRDSLWDFVRRIFRTIFGFQGLSQSRCTLCLISFSAIRIDSRQNFFYWKRRWFVILVQLFFMDLKKKTSISSTSLFEYWTTSFRRWRGVDRMSDIWCFWSFWSVVVVALMTGIGSIPCVISFFWSVATSTPESVLP